VLFPSVRAIEATCAPDEFAAEVVAVTRKAPGLDGVITIPELGFPPFK
jgi:hypothetical protein